MSTRNLLFCRGMDLVSTKRTSQEDFTTPHVKILLPHSIGFGENTRRGTWSAPNSLHDKLVAPCPYAITWPEASPSLISPPNIRNLTACLYLRRVPGLAKRAIHSSPKLPSQNKLCAQM